MIGTALMNDRLNPNDKPYGNDDDDNGDNGINSGNGGGVNSKHRSHDEEQKYSTHYEDNTMRNINIGNNNNNKAMSSAAGVDRLRDELNSSVNSDLNDSRSSNRSSNSHKRNRQLLKRDLGYDDAPDAGDININVGDDNFKYT